MRDYAELIFDLRRHHCDANEDDTQEVCEECAYDVIVADKSKFNGITDVCTCGLMHRAADTIEELVAAVPHWISVEERLPEPRTVVLLFSHEGTFVGYMHDDKRFTVYASSYPERPTHWMPLPEAPKEETP